MENSILFWKGREREKKNNAVWMEVYSEYEASQIIEKKSPPIV
jgi:hypothetical protein